MDSPVKKKKRDPPQNLENQRRYRARKSAAMDGIEEVRARGRQRYYERIARLKAAGEYEAFKQRKCKEGLRRYHTMTAEQREEVKGKNLILQKAWRERMVWEGTYEEYRRRLNARRRQQLAEKKRTMGIKGWREHQKTLYVTRAESERRKRWNWLDEHLACLFPLPRLPLHWGESKPEEDTVQTLCANVLEKMDQYL